MAIIQPGAAPGSSWHFRRWGARWGHRFNPDF